MGLVSWILRAILLTLIVNLVFRLFFPRSRQASRGAPRPTRPPERAGGALVRDPQCGTYIPISRALREGSGESAHYFCSDRCRADWAAAHPH